VGLERRRERQEAKDGSELEKAGGKGETAKAWSYTSLGLH